MRQTCHQTLLCGSLHPENEWLWGFQEFTQAQKCSAEVPPPWSPPRERCPAAQCQGRPAAMGGGEAWIPDPADSWSDPTPPSGPQFSHPENDRVQCHLLFRASQSCQPSSDERIRLTLLDYCIRASQNCSRKELKNSQSLRDRHPPFHPQITINEETEA